MNVQDMSDASLQELAKKPAERDYTKEVSAFMAYFTGDLSMPRQNIGLVCLRAKAAFLAAELEALADVEFASALLHSEAKNAEARKAEADLASVINRRRLANVKACIAGFTSLLPREDVRQ